MIFRANLWRASRNAQWVNTWCIILCQFNNFSVLLSTFSCVYKCVCKQFSERLYHDLIRRITSHLERLCFELQVCCFLDWCLASKMLILYILVHKTRFYSFKILHFPNSSYTQISPKKLFGVASDSGYNLLYISVRSIHVSTKQFNLICNYQPQFCVLICFIQCFKNIKMWVPAISNNFSLISCIRS